MIAKVKHTLQPDGYQQIRYYPNIDTNLYSAYITSRTNTANPPVTTHSLVLRGYGINPGRYSTLGNVVIDTATGQDGLNNLKAKIDYFIRSLENDAVHASGSEIICDLTVAPPAEPHNGGDV